MKASATYKRLGSAVLALCLAVMGCSVTRFASVGDMKTETRSVDLEAADTAGVRIEMDAGELQVAGGADQLMQASFRYNVAEWQPQVNYSVTGSQGELAVTQQGEGSKLPVGKEVINEWNIHLNDAVPLDVVIRTGAGESTLDLSSLNLSALQVQTGAGTTSLDLRGNWEHDLTVAIEGGVGELSVKLPAEMGVRANMDTALVSVTANGLIKDENGYVNQALGTAPHTLTLNVQAGV
ncbi:MAG: toast rack family protein, partial [Anaerolineae bacterium]